MHFLRFGFVVGGLMTLTNALKEVRYSHHTYYDFEVGLILYRPFQMIKNGIKIIFMHTI